MIRGIILSLFLLISTPLFGGEGAFQFDLDACPSYTLTFLLNENGGTAPVAIKKKFGVNSYKTLSFVGTPVWRSGFAGSALYFPSGSSVDGGAGNDAFWEFPTGSSPWTLKAIVSTVDTTNQLGIFYIGESYANLKGIMLETTSGSKFFMNNQAGYAQVLVKHKANYWNVVFISWNPVTNKLSMYNFYDGKLQGYDSQTGSYNLAYDTTHVFIGSCGSNSLFGTIDSVQLVKECISVERMEREYSKMIKRCLEGNEQ